MKENLSQIKIVFIGNSCLVSGHKVTIELQKKMEAVAVVLGTSLELALLDADFFQLLNEPNLNSVNDLNNVFSYFGLVLDDTANIELWINRKRRKTIKSSILEQNISLFTDINEEMYSLFPLYNVQIESLELGRFNPNIIFMERNIGGVSEFSAMINRPDLSKFIWSGFDIFSYNTPNILILSDITYDGVSLSRTNLDNLVRSRQIYL